jgi:hypothetical protein
MAEKKKFNLKGLFIQSEVEEVTTPKAPSAPIYTAPSGAATSVVSSAQVNTTISASLTQALEDANLPSYDYLEFAQAIDQQASIIADEATRFKSVGMIAAQMGSTPEKLIEAANKYIGVLKKKEEEFLSTMGDNVKTVDALEKETSNIDVRIAELTEEMTKLQNEKKTKMEQVSQNRIKIETVKAEFYATLNVFIEKINKDVEKIRIHLIRN